MTVHIKKLPEFYHRFSEKFWPGTPPIFQEGRPSKADWELARALFAELDEHSKRWYRRGCRKLFDGL